MLLTVLAFSSPSAQAQQPPAIEPAAALADLEQTLVEVIRTTEKSVVAIGRGRTRQPGDPAVSDHFVPYEYGTGVVVDPNGLILTNYHLLGEVQQSVYAVWLDGQMYYPARVKAADPWTDLAILQIDAENLQPLALGNAQGLQKGQFVLALGNPQSIVREGSPSASWGIISNLSRKAEPQSTDRSLQGSKTVYEHGALIQTDARLAGGSSGGPLLNLRGEMIGLVTSATALAGYDAAASYAIPANEWFRRVLEQLKAGREVEFGFLGVQPEPLSTEERAAGRSGVRLGLIARGTPAARDGLRFDDVITHLDNRPIRDPDDLFLYVSLLPPGRAVQVTLHRTDPLLQRRRVVTREVILAKKYVAADRPRITTQPSRYWRGIRIDHATAVPQFDTQTELIDAQGCVAVVDVVADSAAWQAGIRPGMFISHLAGQRVATPEAFWQQARQLPGAVELQLTDPDHPIRTVAAE